MKEIVNHPIYGEIIYNENIWTGKRTLTVNGVNAQAVSKREYLINGKGAYIKGNFLGGSSLLIEDKVIPLSPKAKWYETVLAMIPLLFLLIWGNSASLCAIFPVIGGALGGALGGIGSILSLAFMRTQKKAYIKILIGIIAAIVTVLIAFAFALALLSMA